MPFCEEGDEHSGPIKARNSLIGCLRKCMCYGTNVLLMAKGNKLPLFITHSSSKTNSEIPYKPVTSLHANKGF
jgi:hypothetical protein